VRYLLRWADTCLIHAQRLSEWCGHAPVLEEDIALTNMALDLIGQARALLTLAGQLEGQGFDEDQLAFLRDERDYLNPTLVEQPMRAAAHIRRRRLRRHRAAQPAAGHLAEAAVAAPAASSDAELAAIAGKALKEARYHQQHAADWVVRLGDGTDESPAACAALAAHVALHGRAVRVRRRGRRGGRGRGLGPAPPSLHAAWRPRCSGAGRSHAGAAKPTRPSQHRLAGRAQRAHGLHAGRDAVAAARLPRGRVVT
jgi:ring-1,2-phenylacetyl-CoA epoxidase subunit PaaC